MDEGVLPDWLLRSAENYPEREALVCGDLRLTFAELWRRAEQMARRLASGGIQSGTRVALLAHNSPDYALMVHALMRLGAILIPLNTRLTVEELRWQLSDVRATALIGDAAHREIVATLGCALPTLKLLTVADEPENTTITPIATLPEADVLLRTEIYLTATQAIIYTSGTTGQPKGARITYGMHWWNAVGSALNMGLRDEDCWLACLPFYHIGGLSILLRSAIYGMRIVVMSPPFDADAVNAAIANERVSILSVVAVMLQRMLTNLDANTATYLPTLRCVLLGGGPAPLPLLEDCARRNIPVTQTYGLTESCSQATTLAPGEALRRLGSAGRPLAAVRLRITREDGSEAAADEAGEIQLSGPTITPGYDGKPEATRRAFHAGWFATGDLGYRDAAGYLYVLDRRVDLIVSGGENVYPAEIEAALLAHPAVEEVGVCGVADAQWGQAPVAFVRLHADATMTEDALLAFAQERLARYKVPKAVYFVGELPRTSSGKLLRRELPRLRPPAIAPDHS
ncbi:MAG: o-succinylbenzoate--CoA ligase [Ktedonobacterales bacterium]